MMCEENRKKEIMAAICKSYDDMSEFDKGYILGMAEQITKEKEDQKQETG